jgi:RNA polymerase sigma factor for flagellar operon FliA
LTRYEATQGVQFETFATQRIRGAMIDELRESDWMSRGSRKSQKDIEQALRRLEHQLGRSPLESEIAKELGMSLTDYQTLLGKVRGTQLVYLEDMSHGGDGDDGFLDHHDVADDAGRSDGSCCATSACASRWSAIKNLPEREQYVMSMYYEQDMNLKEIAAVLGVTESRVCQLHSQSIARLRAKMRSQRERAAAPDPDPGGADAMPQGRRGLRAKPAAAGNPTTPRPPAADLTKPVRPGLPGPPGGLPTSCGTGLRPASATPGSWVSGRVRACRGPRGGELPRQRRVASSISRALASSLSAMVSAFTV